MKQESMKVLFFIRKSRLKKNGEAPIFLRVTINGQLDEVRIQRSVPLKLWDNVKERSKGKDRSSTELNSYIEALKVRLYQIHRELLCREALITPKNLLIKLFSKEERHLVLQTMRKCIDDWTSLIGTEYQPSTISRYNNCYESLQTVIKDFKQVASEEYPAMTLDNPNQLYEHVLSFEPVKARYLKVLAKPEYNIPSWHGGKGNPAFLFVDEITVD